MLKESHWVGKNGNRRRGTRKERQAPNIAKVEQDIEEVLGIMVQ